MAAYVRPGRDWTFYELDPTVVYLAKDSGRFGFWKDSAANVRYVIGDGRLSLAKGASEPYDQIILDAFSSDAAPTHLLTREALQLYRRKLTKNGIVAFHISNRFLNLEKVVAGLAMDAGMEAVSRADLIVSAAEREDGKLPSQWAVLSADQTLVEILRASKGWGPLASRNGAVLWTDQFSNLPSVFRWSGD